MNPVKRWRTEKELGDRLDAAEQKLSTIEPVAPASAVRAVRELLEAVWETEDPQRALARLPELEQRLARLSDIIAHDAYRRAARAAYGRVPVSLLLQEPDAAPIVDEAWSAEARTHAEKKAQARAEGASAAAAQERAELEQHVRASLAALADVAPAALRQALEVPWRALERDLASADDPARVRGRVAALLVETRAMLGPDLLPSLRRAAIALRPLLRAPRPLAARRRGALLLAERLFTHPAPEVRRRLAEAAVELSVSGA